MRKISIENPKKTTRKRKRKKKKKKKRKKKEKGKRKGKRKRKKKTMRKRKKKKKKKRFSRRFLKKCTILWNPVHLVFLIHFSLAVSYLRFFFSFSLFYGFIFFYL